MSSKCSCAAMSRSMSWRDKVCCLVAMAAEFHGGKGWSNGKGKVGYPWKIDPDLGHLKPCTYIVYHVNRMVRCSTGRWVYISKGHAIASQPFSAIPSHQLLGWRQTPQNETIHSSKLRIVEELRFLTCQRWILITFHQQRAGVNYIISYNNFELRRRHADSQTYDLPVLQSHAITCNHSILARKCWRMLIVYKAASSS